MARDPECLGELVHCEGENIFNYIMSREWLSIDKLIMEMELGTPN
jgi:hypothetical protein